MTHGMGEIDDEVEMEQLVAFEVGSGRYSLPIDSVLEMTPLGKVDAIAGAPDFVRGMMRQRDTVLPVVDLRLRLGMPSIEEERAELIQALTQRKRDHLEWLEELERCCREARRFELGTDPEACAFGQWYAGFRTEDNRLAHILKKFDEPHRRIHEVGNACLEDVRRGDREAAQRRVEDARHGDLAVMVDLFHQVIGHIREAGRELAVVIRVDERIAAVAVDRIVSVAGYRPEEVDPSPLDAVGVDSEEKSDFVTNVIRPAEGGPLIQVLDPTQLFAQGLQSLADDTLRSE